MATLTSPSSLHDRMIRHAISPRLAINTLRIATKVSSEEDMVG
jgi:hypothetical protein